MQVKEIKVLPCGTGATVPGSGPFRSGKRRNSLQVSRSSWGRLFWRHRSVTIRAAVWHWVSCLAALISKLHLPLPAPWVTSKHDSGMAESQQQGHIYPRTPLAHWCHCSASLSRVNSRDAGLVSGQWCCPLPSDCLVASESWEPYLLTRRVLYK